MKFDIEIVNCHGKEIAAIKRLRETLGHSLSEAKNIIDSVPIILLEDIEQSRAEQIADIFEEIGVEINLIDKSAGAAYVPSAEYSPQVRTPQQNSAAKGNDRDILLSLWNEYSKRDQMIKTANDKIKSKKKEISELESEIKLMQKEIDDNKRIKDTKGECLRPRLMRRSLISFPEFNTLKWIFVALAVVAFIIMLILVGVTPKTIEDLAAALNFNAGLMVWLGAPAIGLIGSILFSIGYIIVNIVNGISINNTRVANHKNFDVSKGREKAEAFFNNIESFLAQKKEKEDALAKHKEQLYEMETYKNKLPAVANNLPMPNELRSTSGIALLLQYIDTGRAYTIQEAINLYYQDVKDANKMKELQKQTEYAQEQMMNSRIAAENSRIAAENSRKMYEAANRAAEASERAADAAQEAAHYERNTYWDNVYYRAQNKNK